MADNSVSFKKSANHTRGQDTNACLLLVAAGIGTVEWN